MVVQFASDLHLEFPQNRKFLKTNPLKPGGEVLLLAGDIIPFAVMDEHADFFDYVSDNFQTTYWVPGNHEYYYSDVNQKSGTFYETIRRNVFLVNNYTAIHNDVKIILSALWSKISIENHWYVEKGMSDFQVIKYKGGYFSFNEFNQMHEECLGYLMNQLNDKTNGNSLVVTHHVPTLLNYPTKHKGDVLNEAFAVELFDFIEKGGPDYWIYGHSHANTPNFKIGDTELLTNQLGYVMYNEQRNFQNDRIINI